MRQGKVGGRPRKTRKRGREAIYGDSRRSASVGASKNK